MPALAMPRLRGMSSRSTAANRWRFPPNVIVNLSTCSSDDSNLDTLTIPPVVYIILLVLAMILRNTPTRRIVPAQQAFMSTHCVGRHALSFVESMLVV